MIANQPRKPGLGLPAEIARLEALRADAHRRATLKVPGAWDEVGRIDVRLRELQRRMHDALKPNRRVAKL